MLQKFRQLEGASPVSPIFLLLSPEYTRLIIFCFQQEEQWRVNVEEETVLDMMNHWHFWQMDGHFQKEVNYLNIIIFNPLVLRVFQLTHYPCRLLFFFLTGCECEALGAQSMDATFSLLLKMCNQSLDFEITICTHKVLTSSARPQLTFYF